MPKYEFTGETKEIVEEGTGRTVILHQIRRIIPGTPNELRKRGRRGGWVEKRFNLSEDGDCWIDEGSEVYGDAVVSNNAHVFNSRIYGNAQVFGNAEVSGSVIYEYACVF